MISFFNVIIQSYYNTVYMRSYVQYKLGICLHLSLPYKFVIICDISNFMCLTSLEVEK